MIPFVSQRGGGADLATHLLNSQDNEYVEVHDLRGSVSDDLHGAFAEAEAQAAAMTKAKNYLVSLSINPPSDTPLTREQYEDYAERAGTALGLADQMRAMVFHIKESRDGTLREHCHVVWSRIDVQDCKAIHIAFDRQKLMEVTRGFALDHGITLPDGYHKGMAKDNQLSLYEKAQIDQTGLSREERKDVITGLWQRADSPSAFVAALSDSGYTLAQGKRPYLLVDVYGHVNSLPKLIDDKQVRLADVRAFLQDDFPSEGLPSVEEAKELAERYRDEQQAVELKQEHAQQRDQLNHSQEARAETLESEVASESARHEVERQMVASRIADERAALDKAHSTANDEIDLAREHNERTGFVALLAKVSGAAFIQRKLEERADRLRSEEQHQEHMRLATSQNDQKRSEDVRQNLEMYELRRKQNAQRLTFERERNALARDQEQKRAVQYRQGYQHMPQAALTLTPSGRMAQPARAQHRHAMRTAKELNIKAKPRDYAKEGIDLPHEFAVAARVPDKDQERTGRKLGKKRVVGSPTKGRRR